MRKATQKAPAVKPASNVVPFPMQSRQQPDPEAALQRLAELISARVGRPANLELMRQVADRVLTKREVA